MKAETRDKRNKHLGIQIIDLSDADTKMTGINRFKNLSDKAGISLTIKNKQIEILELRNQSLE